MKRTTGIGLLLTTVVALMAFSNVASANKNHSHKKVVVHSKISIKFQGGGDDQYSQEPNFSGRVQAFARGRRPQSPPPSAWRVGSPGGEVREEPQG